MNFFDKLLQAIERNQSLLYVTLDPEAENQNKTQSDISDRRHLITETANYVCAYN
jgi:uridine monophosphate synthetase